MAQTGFTPISLYYTTTAAATPTAGNLVAGELAINTQDGKLFYKDAAGVVQTLASKAGALGDVVGPASATDNAISRFDATTGKLIQNSLVTVSDTGAISAPVDASISGLTVGKGGGAVSNNTVVGLALYTNTTGSVNSAFGTYALASNTTGSTNNAFGYSALGSTTTSSNNAAFGAYALTANTTGATNTAVGVQSLNSNTTASNNTAVGYQASYSNTTGTANAAFGQGALYANTTGVENAAFGKSALQANTTANANTAFGCQTLLANTTGASNTALGQNALITNTTGSNNTAVGRQAIYLNTTGINNVAVGNDVLANNTASNNTAVGYQAGYGVTTGGNNTFIGSSAGNYLTAITTGAQNIYVGGFNTASSASVNYEIVIGYGITGKGANTGFISPNSGGVYQGNNSATWSITSDARLKKNIFDNNTGLDLINQIQVRNFEYRLPEEITELEPTCAIERTGIQLGVIAQEIAQVSQEFVKTESTGVMSVDTDNLVWYLVNAVKELKTEIDQLKGN
jgi:hypothetical protein